MADFGGSASRFRVSPAPEMFQARIHEAISGLEGVACIADDILIFGSGDNMRDAQLDHDKNLINLLEKMSRHGAETE